MMESSFHASSYWVGVIVLSSCLSLLHVLAASLVPGQPGTCPHDTSSTEQ